ncbi:hypothetical protein [Salinisphaera hydrothermalis]|uniref:Lipoprotein n=1 Tax=Salinisphaera hydrothermalis (strain C41B8) TaxID=1304275 RepID=A0A084IGS6_SALHC|nr:hypothetical protein [Salinisphaera hydrothermalis]KEZ75910.1 hypothetical protein C41B8_17541 [Salinisphaera hydrothermalis C41B8]
MAKILRLPLILIVTSALGACGLIYKPTGAVLNHLAQDEVVPHVYASDDLDMSACGTGLGQTQLLGSFGRVMDAPSRVLLNTHTLAGLCSEAAAQEAQLHFDRALHAGHTTEARDARIQAQRLYQRTAERRLKVYHDTENAFGKIGDGKCPTLGSDTEQMEYLTGLLTSVQAVLSDIRAGSSVGVPQDIAARAARATHCLDNDKWWGVPNALQAVVWLSVPGTAPNGAQPWQQLKAAADLGQSKGMPMAAMLYAEAGYGRSDPQRERDGIRQVAKIYNAGNGPKDYRIFTQVAYREAMFLSDEIWTQKTGQRTPFLNLGTFPGDDKKQNDDSSKVDVDSLLN